MAVSDGTDQRELSADEQRLHELGYAQELRRRMSGFSNFAVSFAIISILSGCLTRYGYGIVVGFAGIYWLVSARHWFAGPKVQGMPEELAAIAGDLR